MYTRTLASNIGEWLGLWLRCPYFLAVSVLVSVPVGYPIGGRFDLLKSEVMWT